MAALAVASMAIKVNFLNLFLAEADIVKVDEAAILARA
jgi:hypothetical protein